MGMQVASLYMGKGVLAAAPQEHPIERRKVLPTEQRISAEQLQASLPGSRKASAPDLKQTTADLEHISLAFNRRLKFIVDQESRQIIVKVIDNETDKVIKVLPPEELQRLHSKIRETIGFLFDKMV